MKWLRLLMIVIAVVVIVPNGLLAQEGESSKELPVAVPLEHNGNQGTWLPQDMALQTQADLAELDRLRIAVGDL